MKKQLPAWLALCIIALAAGLLLALTNALTADRIEEQNAIKANAARAQVLPAATEFAKVELNEKWLSSLPVDDCYEGRGQDGNVVGYTSQITVKGYGGEIEVDSAPGRTTFAVRLPRGGQAGKDRKSA